MARAQEYIMDDVAIFAESTKPQQTQTPDLSEIGSREGDLEVGSDGLLMDQSEITLETYRKMRTDPQVKACLLVLKYPILQVDWSLHADTEDGQTIAKWAELMMRDYGDDSMEYYFREMLTALDFGRSITEKVWTYQTVPSTAEEGAAASDMVIMKKLKTYDPRNVTIKLDPDSLKLIGAEQTTKSGKKIEIPADKLIIFTNEKEFGNYNGEAVLRAAYKPWIIKEFLQKFWNIALERYGQPLQTMEVPQGGSLKKAMALMEMVKSKTGIPVPEGYQHTIHNLANTGMSFKEAIQYQDMMIARAMLIPDLVFGNNANGSGAYALSKTHAGIFLLRLNSITQELGDILTKYLVKPLVRYNFGEVAEYPSLKFNDVAEEDVKQIADVVDLMIKGKVIAPKENWIRERLGMPPADQDAQDYLDKVWEVQESGLDNIQKANAAKAGTNPDGTPQDPPPGGDPKSLDGKTPAAKTPDVKKQADKIQNHSELTEEELVDFLMANLRTSTRGLIRLGLADE